MLRLSAGATVVEPFEASMMTLPSGADLATEAAAISPLAPARFSTTTERFSRSPIPGATMRASRSFGPPGGKPTTRRSGRSGKSTVCAWAFDRVASGKAAMPPSAARRWSLIIRNSC
jgi:hypothetical protein